MAPIFQLSSILRQPVPSRGVVGHLGETRSVGAGSGLLQGAFPLFPPSSFCSHTPVLGAPSLPSQPGEQGWREPWKDQIDS